MTDAVGASAYTYDARGRLTSKQTSHGTLTYTYDAAGNLKTTRSSHASGVSVDYTYDTLNRLASVIDNRLSAAANTTTYAYDEVGNMASVTLPNGVQTSYTYNTLNRLTDLASGKSGSTVASYAYTLGAAGNRESVTEASGRVATYSYDSLFRLTSETITSDAATNGTLGYSYDAVGNRLTRTSTQPVIAPSTSTFDDNDRLTTDSYDANGSTKGSQGSSYEYDFEHRLTSINNGAIAYTYDGDGNRVSKTVGGVMTRYLVDTHNHTGYAQVVEELQGSAVTRQYTYGHDHISQRQMISGAWTSSYYGYDGHGSVRYLTNEAGAVTDTYTYDAFGTLISQAGNTPNEYLYAGERFDSETGMYYLRARYMQPSTGRFWTKDSYEGSPFDPASLHKYLYAGADPTNKIDPSGNFFMSSGEFGIASSIHSTLSAISTISLRAMVSIAMNLDKILYGAELVSLAIPLVVDAWEAADGALIAAGITLPMTVSDTMPLGMRGEEEVQRFLRDRGFTDIVAVQNDSGHGVDIIARSPRGNVHCFEVKTTETGRPISLRGAQAGDPRAYVISRLERAVAGRGHWQNVHTDIQKKANSRDVKLGVKWGCI